MSIESMKRIKSLLQDTKMIDSHTISAVVAECDMAILAQQPATGEPVARCLTEDEQLKTTLRDPVIWVRDIPRGQNLYTHPAPSVPEFSRIAKRKLDELQKQGFGITGYTIQRGTQRGFITDGGFVGWWRSDEAPSVPAAVARDAISTVREHYRGTDWGKAAESICDAIDAMLAAK